MYDFKEQQGKILLTKDNIQLWREIYEINDKIALSYVFKFSFLENAAKYISYIYSYLIGNPELEFLHDEATFENLH